MSTSMLESRTRRCHGILSSRSWMLAGREVFVTVVSETKLFILLDSNVRTHEPLFIPVSMTTREPTESGNQPNRARYLGHVTGNQPQSQIIIS